MSSRQLRRFKEQLQAAKLEKSEDAGSEDDFEPLYVHSNKTSYDLLSPNTPARNEKAQESSVLGEINHSFSSLMTDAPASPDLVEDEGVVSDEPPGPAVTKKKNKNNRKKKNKRREHQASTTRADTDEIDRAVAEVNSLLGEPAQPRIVERPTEARTCALRINHKHLNPQDELTRRFGPDEEERRNQRPNVLRQLKRQIILPNDTYNFFVSGLSMEQIASKGCMKCFKFIHSPKYQLNVRALIAAVEYHQVSMGPPEYDVYNMTTIEAALQNVDLYFMLEEATVACNALEGSIHFLQNIFCPSFNYFDGHTLLEYEHVENRMFHIILLKFLHLLTNKACHRTALEIAKLLMNLDPTDPLGVIFIVDTLALRAREHQWLVEIYQQWEKERDAGKLFHLLYSHALAHYHLYLKSKKQEDLDMADRHLKEALQLYPNVGVMLLRHCQQNCPEVTDHELFATLPKTTTSDDLRDLQKLYVAFAGPKWREGNIMQWFVANAIQLSVQYNEDPQMKADCYAAANARHLLFRENPIEIKRHLYVIRSMSSLLVEGAVPNMKESFSFNPYPTKGRSIDVNGYHTPRAQGAAASSGWRSFMESLVPAIPDNNG